MSTDRTSRRQHEALLVAAQCAEVLRQHYGARRIIPFGSLVGDGPWHEGSDLDLAVQGLSAEALREAEKHLEAMVPSWLAVDLVSLEHTHPTVRVRILGEQPMPDNPRDKHGRSAPYQWLCACSATPDLPALRGGIGRPATLPRTRRTGLPLRAGLKDLATAAYCGYTLSIL